MTKIVASHECTVLYGSYTGRKFQRAAQPSASAERTLADALQAMGQFDIEQVFFWVNVYSGIVVALHLDKSTLTRLGM